MSWKRRFEIEEFLKNSLWLLPVIGVAVGVALKALIMQIDETYGAPPALAYDPGTASALLTSIIAAMISFTGFVLTILVLVVQFAGVSFSPRLLIFVFRDRQLKVSISFFVGTTTFAFLLLTEINDDFVPQLGVLTAGILVLTSVLLFLQFLSHLLHGIRPSNLAQSVGMAGHRVIEQMYPQPAPASEPDPSEIHQLLPDRAPDRIVRQGGKGQVIQSLDLQALVEEASRVNALFVLPHAVGDFAHRDAPLIQIFGSTTAPDSELAGHIAAGSDRTVEQDPAFALRVLVDIAIKALSPAINDPTTATAAIDRIEDLLIDLVGRDLDTAVHRDHRGTVRVILETPDWEDFLQLGVSEVRVYGASSLQTNRRLGALLDSLLDFAPDYRCKSIRHQRELLERSIGRKIVDRDDREFARIADEQGIGAPTIEESA